MFDLIPRYWALSPAKIIHKRFTRYGNACILIESVHRLLRENTKAWFRLDRNAIVESCDSSTFMVIAIRLVIM